MKTTRLLIAALLVMSPFAVNADIIRFDHNGSFSYTSGDFLQIVDRGPSGMRYGWFEFDPHDHTNLGGLRFRNANAWSAFSWLLDGFSMQRGHAFGHLIGRGHSRGHSHGDFGHTDSHRYFWVDSRYTIDLVAQIEPESGSVSVPEPGTLGLLGAALAGIGLMRRRRPV